MKAKLTKKYVLINEELIKIERHLLEKIINLF